MKTGFIGIIPRPCLQGKPLFVSAETPFLCQSTLQRAKYLCEINGGRNRYFYIKEYYIIERPGKPDKLGNIKQIHHFNKEKLSNALPWTK